MLQEVVIKTNASKSLKPLVEAAIRNQIKSLRHGIQRTKERIAEFEKRGDLAGLIRGEVECKNGSSLLFFRELLDLRQPLQKVMYAYHYQTKDGKLIFRYDHTAHHKDVSTFPNHKHLKSGSVTSSESLSLQQVLREVEEILAFNENS